MKKRLALLCAAAICLLVVAPSAAVASSDIQTFELEMEVPNVAQAPNGDMVAVTGHGEFSVHPKSVEASGNFTHTDSSALERGRPLSSCRTSPTDAAWSRRSV